MSSNAFFNNNIFINNSLNLPSEIIKNNSEFIYSDYTDMNYKKLFDNLLENIILSIKNIDLTNTKFSSIKFYSEKNKFILPSMINISKKFVINGNVFLGTGLFYVVFIKTKVIIAKPINDTFIILNKKYEPITTNNFNENILNTNLNLEINSSNKDNLDLEINSSNKDNLDLEINSSNKDNLDEKNTENKNTDNIKFIELEQNEEISKQNSVIINDHNNNINNSYNSYDYSYSSYDDSDDSFDINGIDIFNDFTNINNDNNTKINKNSKDKPINLNEYILNILTSSVDENSINSILQNLSSNDNKKKNKI
jgi:hypothetical protein